MANRNFNRVQALEKEVKILAGALFLSGSPAVPTTGSFGARGTGVTATRTAAGTYRIDLDDDYPYILSSHFSIVSASAGTAPTWGVSILSQSANPGFAVVAAISGAFNSAPADPAHGHLLQYTIITRNLADDRR